MGRPAKRTTRYAAVKPAGPRNPGNYYNSQDHLLSSGPRLRRPAYQGRPPSAFSPSCHGRTTRQTTRIIRAPVRRPKTKSGKSAARLPSSAVCTEGLLLRAGSSVCSGRSRQQSRQYVVRTRDGDVPPIPAPDTGPTAMWTSLAVAAALSLTPAQQPAGALQLTNVRMTIGELGGIRPNAK